VSGLSFEQFLEERVFAPLAMVDTAFNVPSTKVGRFAAVYGRSDSGGLKLLDAPATSPYAGPTRHPSGGGGLVSTAGDYLRFAQMLLNRGELDRERLLHRETVELMTTNALPAGVHYGNDPDGGGSFGLGVGILEDPARLESVGSVGSYGWSGAATTDFWVDPSAEVIGIFIGQFRPHDRYPVMSEFRKAVYQALGS
jgi:CubicO group peptidase (beta-lactamase class C family)